MATRLTIRLDFELGRRLGAGKVRARNRSSRPDHGRRPGASNLLRRAWLLVDELNQPVRRPVVAAHHGGAKGGVAR